MYGRLLGGLVLAHCNLRSWCWRLACNWRAAVSHGDGAQKHVGGLALAHCIGGRGLAWGLLLHNGMHAGVNEHVTWKGERRVRGWAMQADARVSHRGEAFVALCGWMVERG